jgi:Fe-S-cluster containining protein
VLGAKRPHDLARLRALYEEADRLLDGWTCDRTAECCHFGRTGREPYLWSNEWALAERAIAARGGGGGGRRGLRVVPDEDRTCQLLGRDGRCTIYEARPFGCRTFFCERGVGPGSKLPRAELMEIGRKIADLARREDPLVDGPRPLRRLLQTRGK